MAKSKKINVGKKPLPPKIEEEEDDDIISAISEDSEDLDLDEMDTEDMYLDDDAEEKLDDYLEGAPAIITGRDSQPPTTEDYPTPNHLYCLVKKSETHKEVTPEHNQTLIIRKAKTE